MSQQQILAYVTLPGTCPELHVTSRPVTSRALAHAHAPSHSPNQDLCQQELVVPKHTATGT